MMLGARFALTYLWLVGNGGMVVIVVNCTPFLHSLLTKGKLPSQTAATLLPMMQGAGFALLSDSCNTGVADAHDALYRSCTTAATRAADAHDAGRLGAGSFAALR